ncbi:hypothetical protein DPMN_092181 [Dreissena polymorpha]|uniref:Uncharacterized protein n=1 Tax=Dreissena polymorpha TaxID=45954 RepID=A0A9D4L348_DREPO|nr:hypothetical protein DPMN_092181 [Dreissena polymorpha]
MTKSGAPQCRQCDTVFTDREPYTVPCRFHAHAPVLYKILHKQEDPTDADPPMSDKLLFWPCCQKRGTVVPVGCRQLKFHDIPGEETDRD